MSWYSALFFFFSACAFGFHFKRPPQLLSHGHHDTFILPRQQRSISSRDTSCYALDDNDGKGTIAGTSIPVVNEKSEDNGALPVFLFDRNNDNPTQAEVDAYFRGNPDPSPLEVADILQRIVKWKKKKKIDVLTGDKPLIVMSSLQRMMPVYNLRQLRSSTVGTLECLQVISPTDIAKSGSWYSFVWSRLSL